MEFNKVIFAGFALGCLAAAGAGGYLAARQSAPAARVEASTPAPVDPAAPVTAGSPRAVAESEGIIVPASGAAAAEAPAPAGVQPPPVTTARREAAPRPTRTTPAPAPTPRASSVPVTPTRSTRNDSPAPAPAPAPAAANTGGGMWEPRASVEPERAPREPEPPPPPPAPEYMEVTIPSDAVLGLQIERTVSSELARVEDRVDARVTRDVRVGDRVAIPAGSLVQGSVMEVERGGKVKDRAKLGVRFHTVVLADGTRLNIKTDSVVREGPSPAKESTAKIGGAAAGGAILGAILGGGKGAVIGGSIGAAGGTAATMAGNRQPAVLPAGSTVTVRVQQPVSVTVEK